MPVALTTLILCDFAQVREQLLFVSSGGVSRVQPGQYPASIRVQLALMLHVPPDELDREHAVQVRFKYPDTAERIANVDVHLKVHEPEGSFPGEGVNVPQVLDLAPIPFPRPGQVDVQVSIDDEPAGDLTFWLFPPSIVIEGAGG